MAATKTPLRRLLISHDAAERHGLLVEWLGTQEGECLVLAPTRAAADELLRSGCAPGGGWLGIHRATLVLLAGELATPALAARGLTPLGALGREAMAARAIARCRSEGALTYFSPVARAPGFPRALARTLHDLRSGGLGSSELEALCTVSDAVSEAERGDAGSGTGDPGAEGSSAALADLARLLSVYEEELEASALVDTPGLLRLARESLAEETPRHRLVGLPLALLDLAPRGCLEEELLEALVTWAPSVLATSLAGDGVANRILGGFEDLSSEPLAPSGGRERRLDRMRRRIFQPRLEPGPETPDDGSVEVLTAPGEGRECVEIVRRARDLAADGLTFDRMAVLLRDPPTYLPLMEEALRRAQVPAWFSRGTRRPHPAGRALLALLACADENLSATRFAEYLSLGQVPTLGDDGALALVEVPWVPPLGDQLVLKTLLPPAEAAALGSAVLGTDEDDDEGLEDDRISPVIAGTLRTPRRWEQLLVDAAVLGGADRWRRRLAGLAEELRLRFESLGDDDHPRRRRLERQIEQLDRLEHFALPLVAELAALPDEASWGTWLDALEPLAAKVLRDSDAVLQVFAELRPMEQVGPVRLDEVRRVLEERLSDLRTEPPTRRHGRLFVGTLDEARGRRFEVVFLPGLAEGIFPRRTSEDPLLLDAIRRRLDGALPTRADRVEDERLLLRLAADAARHKLVVSYPNLDALQGRSRVPSFYALDVLRAAEGQLPDARQLEERAARGADAILGWPAPRDPQRAIDETEFDLAIIEPLLRLPPAEARARGRYLLDSNEHLTRALRHRYRRWQPRFSGSDGIVRPDPETHRALEEHRLHRRAYSPTALQHFAACPYRFLLSSVFGLRPRDEVGWLERLDPATRGSLFHRAQHALFQALREHELFPLREEDLGALLDLVDRTLDTVARELEDRLAPAIPRVWASEIEGLRSDLRGWIRSLLAAGGPWRPLHFELAFGLDQSPAELSGEKTSGEKTSGEREISWGSADPLREALVAEGKRLRGSIDLVEIDDQRQVLRVTDHKTGSPPRDQDILVGHGELLQPLLYALAAEVLLGRPVEAGRLSYCTRKGRFEERVVPLDSQSRDAIGRVLATIDRALAAGFLPAAPREEACETCDYKLVCGPHEEQRFALKRRDTRFHQALLALDQLRRSP